MDTEEHPGRFGQGNVQPVTPGRLIALQGRLARPYWGLMGGWAAWCGALVSKQLRWEGQSLLTLALVLILADLAWGSLWELATGTGWLRLVGVDWSPTFPASPWALPYTRPDSPGGRLFHQLHRFGGWWRHVFWPAAGPSLLGLLASVALVVVLSLLLPDRLRPLNAALVALVGLGVAQQTRGREPLVGQALVQVGLSWLAGHLAFSEMERASLVLALVFAVAAWGALRVAKGCRGGLWLLNGGLAASVVLAVVLKQPLAAGGMGLLLSGVVALELVLRSEGNLARARLCNCTGPWLMAIMLVAALAIA